MTRREQEVREIVEAMYHIGTAIGIAQVHGIPRKEFMALVASTWKHAERVARETEEGDT